MNMTGLSCTKGEKMAYTDRQWITLFQSSVIPKTPLTPLSSQTDFQNIRPTISIPVNLIGGTQIGAFFPLPFYCHCRDYLGAH